MKKVLLLGDSIRIGYQSYVKELLNGTCDVYYAENDNGRFASYTLWQLNQLFKLYGKFDVVHWNNGYWDMNIEPPMLEAMHPINEYVYFLKRIIKEIQNNGAKIIFATTLPVLVNGKSIDNTGTNIEINYDNNQIKLYNTAAINLMKQHNITVNDLYSLMLQDKNFYKCKDGLHLTSQGYKICAEQISEYILDAIEK